MRENLHSDCQVFPVAKSHGLLGTFGRRWKGRPTSAKLKTVDFIFESSRWILTNNRRDLEVHGWPIPSEADPGG